MSGPHQALLMAASSGSGRPTVTWNPSDAHGEITLSGGNLTASKPNGASTHRSVRATYGIPDTESGYFEVLCVEGATFPNHMVGVATLSAPLTSYVGSDANGWSYYQGDGQKITNAGASSYGATWTNGDIIGVAFKNGKVWFAKNNTWQASGDPAAGTNEAFSGITGTIYPALTLYYPGPPIDSATGRFKTSDFTYSPPSGFTPWGS